MNDTIMMKITEGSSNLSCVEFDNIFIKSLLVEQVIIKVTSSNIFQEEVYSIFVLEHIIHAQYEWMI